MLFKVPWIDFSAPDKCPCIFIAVPNFSPVGSSRFAEVKHRYHDRIIYSDAFLLTKQSIAMRPKVYVEFDVSFLHLLEFFISLFPIITSKRGNHDHKNTHVTFQILQPHVP